MVGRKPAHLGISCPAVCCGQLTMRVTTQLVQYFGPMSMRRARWVRRVRAVRARGGMVALHVLMRAVFACVTMGCVCHGACGNGARAVC